MILQGSSWRGPAAEEWDMWAREVCSSRFGGHISMLPSEYINKQVPVTQLQQFEPVVRDFEHYPNLAGTHWYATDYPHVEGGKESKMRMYEQIAPPGIDTVEKFFVKNAKPLLTE